MKTNKLDTQVEELFADYKTHRVGSHSDDRGGSSDRICFCDLTKKITALLKVEVAKAKIAEVHPDKEYLLIVPADNPESYVSIIKKIPQIKLIVAGEVSLKEIQEHLAEVESNKEGAKACDYCNTPNCELPCHTAPKGDSK